MSGADTLLTGIGQLVTNDPAAPDLLGVVGNAAVAIREGQVTWAGSMEAIPAEAAGLPEHRLTGQTVVPGFVDAHTHMVFAGDRAEEFGLRQTGATYEEIMAAGGGIQSTVTATRAAAASQLLEGAVARAQRMLAAGTTTVEVKSGYGLDVATEVWLLEVARAMGEEVPLDVVPTFLGAHTVPTEMKEDREAYLGLIEDEMLPACAPLARFCDVFCENGVFTVEESRRVLAAGVRHGLIPRVHADQLSVSGGSVLAAEMGAASADHLDHAGSEAIDALKTAGTVAVLLPGVTFSMGIAPPPARALWDAGVPVAVATDLNPGTSFTETMPFMVALGVLVMGLTPQEALWAATRGGALALRMPDRGWIGEGSIGDLVVLAADSHLHIPYRPDTNLVETVIKGGAVVSGLHG